MARKINGSVSGRVARWNEFPTFYELSLFDDNGYWSVSKIWAWLTMETLAIPTKLDFCSILTSLISRKTPCQTSLLDTPVARAVCTHDCPRYSITAFNCQRLQQGICQVILSHTFPRLSDFYFYFYFAHLHAWRSTGCSFERKCFPFVDYLTTLQMWKAT